MLLNKSSSNHHSDDSDVPMLVRQKKIDDEENDMVVEPMTFYDGNIFDILTLEISIRYTL